MPPIIQHNACQNMGAAVKAATKNIHSQQESQVSAASGVEISNRDRMRAHLAAYLLD